MPDLTVVGIGKFVCLFLIIILSIVITQPIFAETQIEAITEFDKETEQMILTLKGTDFYPDLKILWVVVHDIGIDFTIANGNTNSDAQGNFLDSTNVKHLAESGNYIIRVFDVERHEFKERLELNDFPNNALSWTLTPKNFKVGESTVIDIKGTVNVDIDYNRDIIIRVDQPDHQWAAIAESISLTNDNEFHIAKKVNFRVPGEHLVIIEYNGLVRQSSFTVFPEAPEPQLLEEPKSKPNVPGWIKNNAKWWSEGQIDDDTFVSGIQFLMTEKIINIPDLPEQASEKARPTFVDPKKDPQSYVDRYNNEASYKEWFDKNYPEYTIEEAVGLKSKPNVPDWIKNNAQWWADGLISENDFVQGIEYLVGKGIIKLKEESSSLQKEEVNSIQKEEFNFGKSRNDVLFSLSEVRKAHGFEIEFDKDLTSKQKEGAILHSYKIVHETDGWIGGLTFYSGKPDLFPPSNFDKIFRVKFFISNEYGVKPTSAALPIIKSSLEELVPEWNMINKDQKSSDWIDAVIQYSQSDSSGEKNETIRSDQQEIKFAYNEKGGFAELIITQKIS